MYDPEFDPQPVFRVSSEEINLVLAKLHREKGNASSSDKQQDNQARGGELPRSTTCD